MYALVLGFLCVACSAQPSVDLPIGRVVGRSKQFTNEFLGIPFAKADRWKPPKDLHSTPFPGGEFSAVGFGPCCPQADVGLYIPSQDEDCLSLNIFAPNTATNTSNFPVMMWIYGGGGTTGCSAQANPSLYNGSNLISQAPEGVIVVTINYRLSVFSTLYLDLLANEDPEWPSSGSYGHLDMISALRWIQVNIIAFGGDASRVTVFGESAGGNSAVDLGATPLASGLFTGLIAESTTAAVAAGWANKTIGNARGMEVVTAAGCATAADVLACMRAKPSAELLNYLNLTQLPGVVDGLVFPHYPATSYKMGLFPKGLRVMAGNNLPDNFPFCAAAPGITKDKAIPLLIQQLQLWGIPDSSIESVLSTYQMDTCEPTGKHSCCFVAQTIMQDYAFRCNVQRVMRAVTAVSPGSAFWYQLDCHPTCPPSSLPVCQHTSEIAFVFGTVSDYQSSAPPACSWDDATRSFSKSVTTDWVRFASKGVPDPSWDPFGSNVSYFFITPDAPFSSQIWQGPCQIWDDIDAAIVAELNLP